jgi:hypothetical protein
MSNKSSDQEDIVSHYLYEKLFKREKKERNKRRKFWIHPYIQRNHQCWLYVSTRKLLETDVKCVALYSIAFPNLWVGDPTLSCKIF